MSGADKKKLPYEKNNCRCQSSARSLEIQLFRKAGLTCEHLSKRRVVAEGEGGGQRWQRTSGVREASKWG